MKSANGPCWGYHKKTGEAELFADGNRPKEYMDTPAKCDPAKDKKSDK